MSKSWPITLVSLLFLTPLVSAQINTDAINKWADTFAPSTLDKQQRIDELTWFAQASQAFRGKRIKSVAEGIKTHEWERDLLAQAFAEITGITVVHEITGEGSVVERIMQQLSSGQQLYDIYINDGDMIGTHLRSQGVVVLSDYMQQAGKSYTNPYLDLDDFLNLEFGQDYDGNQLQLPDQQFANLYWFRYDWFTDPAIKEQFQTKYGYELGVPVNWAAYEDIAEFFTNTPINGQKVYGHLDYGRKSPSLGWRFTDAWLSIAGVGDPGLPNGLPVDEWGIRVENKIPVGSSVKRGGATNGPAAVYALDKYISWLNQYAPPEAKNWRWSDAGPKGAEGNIAQRIFQYVTWLSDERFHQTGSPVVGADGHPLWRVAPTPRGRYWQPGMKVGYQDAGSWTIPRNVRGDKRAMAWLWAQFCVSKTVALKKFLVGGTPVRKSTVHATYLDDKLAQWGGLIEFYRSPEENKWTDSGPNVPNYPAMSAVWWPNIGKAIQGKISPQQALDRIANAQDAIMAKMKGGAYTPKLNPQQAATEWLAQPGSPKAERPEEAPLTIQYDTLLQQWTQPQ